MPTAIEQLRARIDANSDALTANIGRRQQALSRLGNGSNQALADLRARQAERGQSFKNTSSLLTSLAPTSAGAAFGAGVFNALQDFSDARGQRVDDAQIALQEARELRRQSVAEEQINANLDIQDFQARQLATQSAIDQLNIEQGRQFEAGQNNLQRKSAEQLAREQNKTTLEAARIRGKTSETVAGVNANAGQQQTETRTQSAERIAAAGNENALQRTDRTTGSAESIAAANNAASLERAERTTGSAESIAAANNAAALERAELTTGSAEMIAAQSVASKLTLQELAGTQANEQIGLRSAANLNQQVALRQIDELQTNAALKVNEEALSDHVGRLGASIGSFAANAETNEEKILAPSKALAAYRSVLATGVALTPEHLDLLEAAVVSSVGDVSFAEDNTVWNGIKTAVLPFGLSDIVFETPEARLDAVVEGVRDQLEQARIDYQIASGPSLIPQRTTPVQDFRTAEGLR